MGTLTAGIKEIFSSAKTTGSNVMLCGNDGTPDGHMTMANLANVLGGTHEITPLQTVNVEPGKILEINYAQMYGSIIIVRGNSGALSLNVIASGYGADIIRQEISVVGRGGDIHLYVDRGSICKLYISSTNGDYFTAWLANLGARPTLSKIDSLPSNVYEVVD